MALGNRGVIVYVMFCGEWNSVCYHFRMSNHVTMSSPFLDGWWIFKCYHFTLIYFRLATIINLIILINISRLLCRALQTYK